MKRGVAGFKVLLLFIGVIVFVFIAVAIKSSMDLRKEYNINPETLNPKEETKEDEWWLPKNETNETAKDTKKCLRNVEYNVTLNRTKTYNVTEISCDPADYNISVKTITRKWEDVLVNGTVKDVYYMKEALLYNNENASLCVEVRLDFLRTNILGQNESVGEESVTFVVPAIYESSTPIRYKWYTEKDMKKDYAIVLQRILPKEECRQVFHDEFVGERNSGEISIINEDFLERKRVEGCFKELTKTIEEIEYYNETRIRTEEYEC